MNAPLSPRELSDAEKYVVRIARRRRQEDEAHRIASIAARADQTDPFTYGRVYTHVLNGIGEEHSYGSKGN